MKKSYTGTCCFCGQHGKLTKEHLFSKWLGEYFPRDVQRTDTTKQVEFRTGLRSVRQKKRSGAIHTRRDAIVCAGCNNTWMSAIVGASKPVEEKIIRAHGDVSLSGDELVSLRNKICLTALTVDRVQVACTATPSARMDFMRTRETRMFDTVHVFYLRDPTSFTPWAQAPNLNVPALPSTQQTTGNRLVFKSIAYAFGQLGAYVAFSGTATIRPMLPAVFNLGLELLPTPPAGAALLAVNKISHAQLALAANAMAAHLAAILRGQAQRLQASRRSVAEPSPA